MTDILITIFNLIPRKTRKFLGRSGSLKLIRDLLFRKGKRFREKSVLVRRRYRQYDVKFKFYASLQIAAKAKKRGFENKLLRNSMELLIKYKGEREDFDVFDVGCNFGYLSLVWANSIAKNGKVIGFEPNSLVADSFIKSIKANHLEKHLLVEKMALGKKKGIVTFYNYNTTSNINKIMNGRTTSQDRTPVETLDDYIFQKQIPKVDLIKIDVDGTELDILEGALLIIKKYKPILIVEVNDRLEVFDFFNSLNYTILDMDLKVANANSLPPNIFCVPNNLYLSAV